MNLRVPPAAYFSHLASTYGHFLRHYGPVAILNDCVGSGNSLVFQALA